MRVVLALLLSKAVLALLIAVAVVGGLRGRLRFALRLHPDAPSPVPTRWALSVGAGARLHRRLQIAVADITPHLPRTSKFRRTKRDDATATGAGEVLAAAHAADRSLARAARTGRTQRRAALRAAAAEVEHVEGLAARVLARAARDSSGQVIDTSATVVRLDP